MKLSCARSTILIAFAMTSAAVLPTGSRTNAADEVPTLEEVIQTLRARQEKCRTAHVKWSESRLQTLFESDGPRDAASARKKIAVPKHESALYVADRMLRYEIVMAPKFEPRISGFDGKRDWSFTPRDRNNRGSGVLREVDNFSDMESNTIRALLLYLRPLHPLIANVRPETYVVQPGRVTMEDRPCIELSEKAGIRGPLRNRIWLDVERGLVAVRSTEEVEGRIGAMVNVEYQDDPQLGWLPSRWKATFFGGDRMPLEYSECETISFDLNGEIDANLFLPNFPDGARVTLIDREQKEHESYSLGGDKLRPYQNSDD